MSIRRTTPIPLTYLRVKKSKSGLGLFADGVIQSGMYIEYVGLIISTPEADKMSGAKYLFEINSKWTINGSMRTNLARYINHSCLPNCESVQNGMKIYIKATQLIVPGEELTYDYGTEYFDEFIKPYGCTCHGCSDS